MSRNLIALSAALAMTGCSFVAVQRAPKQIASHEELRCTEDLTYPLIDMSATVLAGVLAVSLLSRDGNEDSFPTGAAVVGAAALTAASSSIYGIYQVGRCRPAMAEWRRLGPSHTGGQDAKPAGALGGACKPGNACDSGLKCDEPMQVCVPDDPSEF